MDDNKTNQVASQTEIPVSDLKSNIDRASTGNKNPIFRNKLLIGMFFLIILITFFSYLFFNLKQNDDFTSAYNAGDYKSAQNIVDNRLKNNPNDPILLAQKIQINATLGNQTGQEQQQLENTKQYIEKLLATSPKDAETLIVIGYSYETAGDYITALKFYDQAIKSDPESSNAWFHKGHALAFLGNEKESIGSYDKSRSLNPNNPFVLIVDANSLFGEKKYEEAYKKYKAAADVPGINMATKSEALTAASLARGLPTYNYISEALELSKQAVDANPNFSPALSAYGYNLYMTGDMKGLDYINKAIEVNPRISRNYYLLAMFARGSKKYQESISYNQQALDKISNDNTIVTPTDKAKAKAKVTYELAKTYSISGQNSDVLLLLQQALILDPSIKAILIKDYEVNHFFQDLAQDTLFLNLIK